MSFRTLSCLRAHSLSFSPFPVQGVPYQGEQGQVLAKFAWAMRLTGAFPSLRDDVSALGRGWQFSGCESLVIAVLPL